MSSRGYTEAYTAESYKRIAYSAGTRPSRLRSLTRAGDAEPNQLSTSNSMGLAPLQGSPETSGSGLTYPRGSLTVRTRVKSEPGSDGTGSARTPGSVNIRVWKVIYQHLVALCSPCWDSWLSCN